MTVAVVNYNAGNIRSVLFALERAGVQAVLTDDPDTLQRADKVVFPGVGEAAAAMRELRRKGLDAVIPALRQPVLGICIGMQLLCRRSEEGDTDCLGVLPLEVRRFRPADPALKVPHMGWNQITGLRGRLMPPELEGAYVYFVHSYYVETSPWTSAVTDYGTPFSAAIEHENFFATQFHVEKSGRVGERILRHFLEL